MILPIVAYGTNVLKKKAEVISSDYPGLQQLIDDNAVEARAIEVQHLASA